MNLYSETKFIMKKYNIEANKKLGQNFLINENVVDKIVDSAEISKDDLVIEIGPGLGTLTSKILEKANKVICIELDSRMINILKDIITGKIFSTTWKRTRTPANSTAYLMKDYFH